MNEVHLHILARLRHEEDCTPDRCVGACEVADYLRRLEAPLMLVDVFEANRQRERLEALAHGEIPERLAG